MLNRSDLLIKILENLPDNDSNFITAAKLREVLNELVDSDLNLLDDNSLLGLKVFNTTRTYKAGESCIFDNNIYKCVVFTSNTPPPSSDWVQIITAEGDFIEKSNGIELSDNKKTVTLPLNASTNNLATGLYTVSCNNSNFVDVTFDYPMQGTGMIFAMNSENPAKSIHYYYSSENPSNIFTHRPGSPWLNVAGNTAGDVINYNDIYINNIDLENGIEEISASTYGLGGSLTQNTFINGQENNLNLNNLNEFNISSSLLGSVNFSTPNFKILDENPNVIINNNNIKLNFADDKNIIIDSNAIELSEDNLAGQSTYFNLTKTGISVATDNNNNNTSLTIDENGFKYFKNNLNINHFEEINGNGITNYREDTDTNGYASNLVSYTQLVDETSGDYEFDYLEITTNTKGFKHDTREDVNYISVENNLLKYNPYAITLENTTTLQPEHIPSFGVLTAIVNYNNNILGSKFLSPTAKNPTGIEDGKALTWDNATNNYTLSTISSNIATTKIIYVDVTLGTNTRTSGDTYYINKPFLTIQAAVNAMSNNDTIYVRPGTYTENITLSTALNFVTNIILDRVILNATGTSSNIVSTATNPVLKLHMIDSTIQNTGDGSTVANTKTTANFKVQTIYITTNEQVIKPNNLFSSSNNITISTALRTGRNRIISANSCNFYSSWGSFYELKGIYCETGGSLAQCINKESGANLHGCYFLSRNGGGVTLYQGSSIIDNCVIISQGICVGEWSNCTPTILNSFLYSGTEFAFSGNLNGGGGSQNLRTIKNCVLNSFKRTINYVSGGISIKCRLIFEDNKVVVRDSSTYTYCVNIAPFDSTGSTISDFSFVIARNNISNVEILENHTFLGTYNEKLNVNNTENVSYYLALNPY